MEMDKKRILVVDDEPSFTRMVRLNLEKTGLYEVKEENSARRAAATARMFRPHLVLLDVVMPDMDGGDVATQIKGQPGCKETPIVFITAIVGKGEAGPAGQRSGGHLFLSKPVSLRTLVESIEKNLAPETGSEGQK
jgi:CheY-like chemotaxis protein